MSISNITEEQIFRTLGRGKATDFEPVIPKQRREPVKPEPETVKLTEDPILKEIAESIKTLAINMRELTRGIHAMQKFMPWIAVVQPLLLLIIALFLFVK